MCFWFSYFAFLLIYLFLIHSNVVMKPGHFWIFSVIFKHNDIYNQATSQVWYENFSLISMWHYTVTSPWEILDEHTIIYMLCLRCTFCHISSDFVFDAILVWEIHSCKARIKIIANSLSLNFFYLLARKPNL